MSRINLESTKTTLDISPTMKKKAHRIAQSLNLSMNQYIELLIGQAKEGGEGTTVSDDIAELKQKTAQLDARLQEIQKKVSKK